MQPPGRWQENIRPRVIACIWGPLGFGSDAIWGFAVAEFCGTATTGVEVLVHFGGEWNWFMNIFFFFSFRGFCGSQGM